MTADSDQMNLFCRFVYLKPDNQQIRLYMTFPTVFVYTQEFVRFHLRRNIFYTSLTQ